jgi:hypothetical protein
MKPPVAASKNTTFLGVADIGKPQQQMDDHDAQLAVLLISKTGCYYFATVVQLRKREL